MSNSERLEVDHVFASWGDVPVLHDVSLTLQDREVLALMGPNGSGKTTLLRCIVGLEAPTQGSVRLDGQRMNDVPPHRRGIGMLFQEPALFPGKTVAENIAYGLEIAHWTERAIDDRVAELVDRLGVRHLAERLSSRLSGGERQRVALARTLAPRPRVVLLDEPFASVDPEFRDELRSDFRRVLREEAVAAIHVTHDRAEGLFLGDRVAVLIEGVIRGIGSSREVFDHPSSGVVARFLGYNVLSSAGREVAVHPEQIELTSAQGARLSAKVVSMGRTGPRTEVHLVAEDGRRVAVSTKEVPSLKPGDVVGLNWSREAAWPGSNSMVSSSAPDAT